jgi:hypothetical protein
MQTEIDFDAYPPHQRHSETSRASAAAAAPKFNARTLALLARFRTAWPRGLSDEQGQIELSIDGNSYRPMRVTLYKHGFVEDSGDRQVLKSGRKGVIWRITDAGLSKLNQENM